MYKFLNCLVVWSIFYQHVTVSKNTLFVLMQNFSDQKDSDQVKPLRIVNIQYKCPMYDPGLTRASTWDLVLIAYRQPVKA